MTFSVVQRRPLIGTLRALGVTRGEMFALVLGEALAIGRRWARWRARLGLALAQGLLGLVTRTINDLYFVLVGARLVLDSARRWPRARCSAWAPPRWRALAPALRGGARRRRAIADAPRLLETRRPRGAPRPRWLGLAVLAGGAAAPAPPRRRVAGLRGLFAC